jgi:hypothetical protein
MFSKYSASVARHPYDPIRSRLGKYVSSCADNLISLSNQGAIKKNFFQAHVQRIELSLSGQVSKVRRPSPDVAGGVRLVQKRPLFPFALLRLRDQQTAVR